MIESTSQHIDYAHLRGDTTMHYTHRGESVITAFDIDRVLSAFPFTDKQLVDMRWPEMAKLLPAMGYIDGRSGTHPINAYPGDIAAHHMSMPYMLNWLDRHTEFGWCSKHVQISPLTGTLIARMPLRQVLEQDAPEEEVFEWARSYFGKDRIEAMLKEDPHLFIDGRMYVLNKNMGTRALLWIDDDTYSPLTREWEQRRNEDIAPTKIIQPNERAGLTPKDFVEAREWLEQLTD